MKQGRRKGTPKTGGRQKGTPNKVTREIRETARMHGPVAIAELVRLISEAQSEQVRIAACREILDRGYGKSRMAVEHTGPESGPIPVKKLDDKEAMRRFASILLESRIAEFGDDGKLSIVEDSTAETPRLIPRES